MYAVSLIRSIIRVALVCLLFGSVPTHASQPETIDVVIDIDGVLAYGSFNDAGSTAQTPKIIVDGQSYILTHGASEFIDFVRSIPGVRLSFFSNVHIGRNIRLLTQIKLHDGENAAEAASFAFGAKDLTPTHTKDLTKLLPALPGLRLENTVLVDDWHIHAERGQKENLLLVTPAQPLYMNDLEIAVNIPDEAFNLQPQRDWSLELYRERNKLARVAVLLSDAIADAKNFGISVRDALNQRQYNAAGAYRYNETNMPSIFERGEALLRGVNPSFSLFKPDCAQLLTEK